MRKSARTDLCGGRSVMIVPTASSWTRRASRKLQMEQVHRGRRGEGRYELQREDAQRFSSSPREPFQREVCDDWYLSSHKQLPEVSRGSLVGFTHDAEYRNVTQHQSKGSKGHRHWKEGTRLLHHRNVHPIRREWVFRGFGPLVAQGA